MTRREPSILVIGYGNPAREDDGLGPRCAEMLAALDLPGVTVLTDYQLQVEYADALAEHDAVIFIDADASVQARYELRGVAPDRTGAFSTHRVSAGTLMTLARDLLGADTRAYMLAIRGVSFEPFTEQLTEEANANLSAAVHFLAPILRDRRLAALEERARATELSVATEG